MAEEEKNEGNVFHEEDRFQYTKQDVGNEKQMERAKAD